MMVRPTQSRTREQTTYLEQLIQSGATSAVVFTLAQDFSRLLRKSSEVDQTQFVWTSRLPAAATSCEARILLPMRPILQ